MIPETKEVLKQARDFARWNLHRQGIVKAEFREIDYEIQFTWEIVDFIFYNLPEGGELQGLKLMAKCCVLLRAPRVLAECDRREGTDLVRQAEPSLSGIEITLMKVRERLEREYHVPTQYTPVQREVYELLCKPFEGEWMQLDAQ